MTVTSQPQMDRDKLRGTVQRMLEVELEETEMWSALCELDIECCVSCYNPRYIAQALASFLTAEADEKDEGNDEGAVLKGGRDGRPESAACFNRGTCRYRDQCDMLEQGIQAERKERKLEQREHDEEVRTLGRERAAVLEQDRKVLLQRIDHQVREPGIETRSMWNKQITT